MTEHKPSIIFMGTPEFAVPSLKILLENDYKIKAVVTSVDKPAGRGCKIRYSDVKNFAMENDLLILQPEKLKEPDFISKLQKLDADLFIVVAFRMLPKEVWQLPRLGTFNLHSSLLPNYRGAAPINFAIINGENKTGVTTFFINENIDTGNIILQEECGILPEDNAGSLHDKLKEIGAGLVLNTVEKISSGNFETIEQNKYDLDTVKYAPKITKDFCRINWNDNVYNIHNHIRGLSPYPAAFMCLNGNDSELIKIYKSSYIKEKHNYTLGKIVSDNKSYIKVAASDGFVFIEELQLSGKKRMLVKDFLNGYRF